MDERAWLTRDDPREMLRAAADWGTGEDGTLSEPPHVEDRKLLLFVAACLRRYGARGVISVGEPAELEALAERGAEAIRRECFPRGLAMSLASSLPDAAGVSALLREIFGNPFRPVAVKLGQGLAVRGRRGPMLTDGVVQDTQEYIYVSEWLTPTVAGLARAAYEERVQGKCPDCDGRGWLKWPLQRGDGEFEADCLTCRRKGTPQQLIAYLLDVTKTDSLGGMSVYDAGPGRTITDDKLAALAAALQKKSNEDRGLGGHTVERGLTLTHWHTGNGHLSSSFQLMDPNAQVGDPYAWQVHLKNEVAEGVIRQVAGTILRTGRTPSGHLDPARLAVLADALEEAGCSGVRCEKCHGSGTYTVHVTNAGLSAANGYSPRTTYSEWRGCRHCGGDSVSKGAGRVPNPIITHLRSPGPHVRGCWVVDLLLGKS